MSASDYVQLFLYIFLWTLLTPPLGAYIARVMQGDRACSRVERGIYALAGVNPAHRSDWRGYAKDLLVFNIAGIAVVFLLLRLQAVLPLNPQATPAVSGWLAFNTAVSFVTNTDWQAYAGETTLSYLAQMLALATQNFLSAAVGLSVAVVLARAVANRAVDESGVGNFWVDITRACLYILLPLSVVVALLLLGQGVVQSFAPYLKLTGLEGTPQQIPFGPVASQEAIKMLGTNGGGFFNANSAHPFENPTGLSNFIEIFVIFLIPAALTYTYGTITKARRHGWILFSTMMILFLGMTALSLWSEAAQNPILGASGVMEGKESRFGIFGSVFFSAVTTAASCGAVNAMHASLSPLSGGLAILNMMLGEIVFGGVGAGLYGMLLFVLLTVFVAGLMVGRSPEYLGKKIEAREMTMVILAVLAPGAAILVGTGISVVLPNALASLSNAGPHGFSEILYAFTSAAANNGSAFAGLNVNTDYYNISLALAMLIGRFAVIVPVLAVAGSLVSKRYAPPSKGTFETDGPLFAVLLLGIILIVGALTFVPALSLGPIVEHLLMRAGHIF